MANITDREIKYSPSAERRLKNLFPRFITGSSISTGVFASLGIAALATGIGAGWAVVALVGTAASAAAIVGSSVVYSNSTAQAKFSKIDKKEGLDKVVEEILKAEYVAHQHRQALDLHSGKGKVRVDTYVSQQVKEGKKKTSQQVQTEVKERRATIQWAMNESEQFVYNGLRYLYDKGVEISNKIRVYKKKLDTKGLSSAEQKDLDGLYEQMTSIGEATLHIASERTEFNPYKQLMINAIEKGCLMGVRREGRDVLTDDDINDHIESVRITDNKSERKKQAKEVYLANFEVHAQHKLVEQEQQKIAMQTAAKEQYQRYLHAIKLLNQYKGDLSKLTEEQRQLVAEYESANNNQRLQDELRIMIREAKGYAGALPGKAKDDLAAAIKEGEEALKSADNTSMDRARRKLNGLINNIKNILEETLKKNAELEAANADKATQLTAAQQEAAAQTARADQAEEDAAIRGVLYRNAKALGQKATGMARAAQQDAAAQTARADQATATAQLLYEGNQQLLAEVEAQTARADQAEEDAAIQGVLYRNAKALGQKATGMARAAQQEAEGLRQALKAANTKVQGLSIKLGEAERLYGTLLESYRKATSSLTAGLSVDGKQKAEIKRLSSEIASYQDQIAQNERKIQELDELCEKYAKGADDNLETITDLRVGVEKRDANIEDLNGKISDLERRLKELTSQLQDIDAANKARQANFVLGGKTSAFKRLVKSIWIHIKYCRYKEFAKYKDSTALMKEALDDTVARYKLVKDNPEEIAKLTAELRAKYEDIRKGNKWLNIPRDKIIPGAIIPDDKLDDFYFSL